MPDIKNEKDLQTLAYVLRRTNYGEADRILNLITPEGKISAIAKGVRKAKSKLAGGVEMFTLSTANLHFGKGNLATLTGAKMQKFYSGILKDFRRMELAGEILRVTEKMSEGINDSGYFKIVDSCLKELDSGTEVELVETWFYLNMAKLGGEEVNFYLDVDGNKLEVGQLYNWDTNEMAFSKDPDGEFDANAIKILRLMISTDLSIVKRVKGLHGFLPKITKIGKVFREVVK